MKDSNPIPSTGQADDPGKPNPSLFTGSRNPGDDQQLEVQLSGIPDTQETLEKKIESDNDCACE